jgi:hypothetical protein
MGDVVLGDWTDQERVEQYRDAKADGEVMQEGSRALAIVRSRHEESGDEEQQLEQCRTPALGGHAFRCEGCGVEQISYNSCRNRHCPKCQSAAAKRWLEARQADLLPVEYYHVVFTLPAPMELRQAQVAALRGARQAGPCVRKMSATSMAGCATASASRGRQRLHDDRFLPMVDSTPGWQPGQDNHERSSSAIQRYDSTRPWMSRAQPSSITNSSSLNGSEIVVGEIIDMPSASRIVATIRSTTTKTM